MNNTSFPSHEYTFWIGLVVSDRTLRMFFRLWRLLSRVGVQVVLSRGEILGTLPGNDIHFQMTASSSIELMWWKRPVEGIRIKIDTDRLVYETGFSRGDIVQVTNAMYNRLMTVREDSDG